MEVMEEVIHQQLLWEMLSSFRPQVAKDISEFFYFQPFRSLLIVKPLLRPGQLAQVLEMFQSWASTVLWRVLVSQLELAALVSSEYVFGHDELRNAVRAVSPPSFDGHGVASASPLAGTARPVDVCVHSKVFR